mgnify:CR=1 FL=1
MSKETSALKLKKLLHESARAENPGPGKKTKLEWTPMLEASGIFWVLNVGAVAIGMFHFCLDAIDADLHVCVCACVCACVCVSRSVGGWVGGWVCVCVCVCV